MHPIRLTNLQLLLATVFTAIITTLTLLAGVSNAATGPTAPVSPDLFNTGAWATSADASGPTITHRAQDGTDRATVPLTGGGTRRLVRIMSPSQPQVYRFPVNVPTGGTLTPTADGGAKVTSADGQVLSTIAPPFAIDATGSPVKTKYNTQGNVLTQIVAHRSPATTYPVVADPMCRVWFQAKVWGRIPYWTFGFEWRYRC